VGRRGAGEAQSTSQDVDIPQFESLGLQVGQQIAGAIAGTETVSQALQTSQSDASQYTPAELSAG